MAFTAFFPGQGAQHPGMGAALADGSAGARRVFECAGDVTGADIKKLCFEGTQEELSRTVNSQIAIFTHSLAAFEAAKEAGAEFDACAGFSLGEYTALAASGALSYEDGFRLVMRRGELMQQAADKTPGVMYAVIGLEDEAVEEICREIDGLVLPVNYNCPGQLVIAGEEQAAAKAAEALKAKGAKRAVPLAVSGAFHTPLMQQAAQELCAFAKNLSFSAPSLSVYTNLTGDILEKGDMPEHLEKHMVSPVRWKLLVENLLKGGHNAALELGPGKTLCGFARRISKELSCKGVETMEDVHSIGK